MTPQEDTGGFFDRALDAAYAAYDGKRPRDWAPRFCGAVTALDGEVLASRGGVSPASSRTAVASISQRFTGGLTAGDVVLTNDVWSGSRHPTEFVVLSPAMGTGGEVAGWVELRAAAPDVGGWEIGGYTPRAFDVWAEGVRLVPVLAYLRESRRREAFGILGLNSRTPELTQSFVAALAEGAVAAARHLSGGEWAQARGQADAVRSGSAASIAERLSSIAGSELLARSQVAIPASQGGSISIEGMVSAAGGRLAVGFRKVPGRQSSSVNVSEAMTRDAALLAVAAALELPLAECETLTKFVEVEAPAGSVLAAPEGAPVGYGCFTTCRAVFEAVYIAARGATGRPAGDADFPQWLQPPDFLDPATGIANMEWRAALLDAERRAGDDTCR